MREITWQGKPNPRGEVGGGQIGRNIHRVNTINLVPPYTVVLRSTIALRQSTRRASTRTPRTSANTGVLSASPRACRTNECPTSRWRRAAVHPSWPRRIINDNRQASNCHKRTAERTAKRLEALPSQENMHALTLQDISQSSGGRSWYSANRIATT